MGFLNLFRKDEVVGTKVLVGALGNRFTEFLQQDADAYKSCYPATTAAMFSDADSLIEAVRNGCDVVHLLCDVNSSGMIGDTGLTGTELIERCSDCGVKLLWIASDNDPNGYIHGFGARGKRINLVMTNATGRASQLSFGNCY